MCRKSLTANASEQQRNSQILLNERTNERGMFQLYTKYPLQAYLDKRAHTLLPPFLILSRTLSHFSLSRPTTHPSVPTLIVKPLSLSISFFMCCFYLTFLSKSINTPFYLYSQYQTIFTLYLSMCCFYLNFISIPNNTLIFLYSYRKRYLSLFLFVQFLSLLLWILCERVFRLHSNCKLCPLWQSQTPTEPLRHQRRRQRLRSLFC